MMNAEIESTTTDIVRVILTTDFAKGVSAIQKILRIDGVHQELKLNLAKLILEQIDFTPVDKIGSSLATCFSILLEAKTNKERLIAFTKTVNSKLIELSHKLTINSMAVHEIKAAIFSTKVTSKAKWTHVFSCLFTL